MGCIVYIFHIDIFYRNYASASLKQSFTLLILCTVWTKWLPWRQTFTSLLICLGFVEQPHSGCKESSSFSTPPFPINATHFHVKAKRNRWIPAGEKSSYLTGWLCTWSLKKYNTVLPVLLDNVERNQVHESWMVCWWLNDNNMLLFMKPCDSLLAFLVYN